MAPEDWTEWRFTGRGGVKHAVEVRSKYRSPLRGPYLWPVCDQHQGMQDDIYEDTSITGWLGTATVKQEKKLAALPYCKHCAARLAERAE